MFLESFYAGTSEESNPDLSYYSPHNLLCVSNRFIYLFIVLFGF